MYEGTLPADGYTYTGDEGEGSQLDAQRVQGQVGLEDLSARQYHLHFGDAGALGVGGGGCNQHP